MTDVFKQLYYVLNLMSLNSIPYGTILPVTSIRKKEPDAANSSLTQRTRYFKCNTSQSALLIKSKKPMPF